MNAKHNLKAKHINSSARLFAADKKEVLFMITAPNSDEEMGIWLNSPFFTEALLGILDNSLRNKS
jgi:hypothetical protein